MATKPSNSLSQMPNNPKPSFADFFPNNPYRADPKPSSQSSVEPVGSAAPPGSAVQNATLNPFSAGLKGGRYGSAAARQDKARGGPVGPPRGKEDSELSPTLSDPACVTDPWEKEQRDPEFRRKERDVWIQLFSNRENDFDNPERLAIENTCPFSLEGTPCNWPDRCKHYQHICHKTVS
ncbi:MAG: hypothetical protein Q9227_006691 [Pyrenula ochraceoflavens]